jgi:hypothetical protein
LYQQAVVVCSEVHFRPELGLVRLDLAELLLDKFVEERSAGFRRLNIASAEFRETQMQPSLERALRLAPLIRAAADTHAVGLTALCGGVAGSRAEQSRHSHAADHHRADTKVTGSTPEQTRLPLPLASRNVGPEEAEPICIVTPPTW